ncbi:MAG: RIP metalloprotease RseP [Rhizobiaceae bacterium]
MSETLTKLINSESILIGTLVPFLAILTLVVFVHEMGHYLVGRWCGIGVKAFSVGFGPELLGYTDRRGTRWKLSAIPLGGYVKFLGDENGASIPDQAALENMPEDERKSAFQTQPVWKRALTVAAGPFANVLLTIAVFAVFFGMYGQVVTNAVVSKTIPGSPAEIAGFLPGDKFVSIDGNPVNSFADLQRYVGPRADQEMTFVMDRKGQQVTLKAAPTTREIDDALGNKVKVAVLGVQTTPAESGYEVKSFTPLQAIGQSVKETAFIATETGNFLVRLVKGREDKCQLGGPVKIATMAGQAAKRGIEWLIQLAAILSIGIGILNLLPIPPLDGGHLLLYGMESVMRRPVSAKMQDVVFRIGGLLVLSFMGFVFFNDLFAC